jgi:hypothetical protein
VGPTKTTAEVMDAMADQLRDLINIPSNTLPIEFASRAFVLVPPCVDMYIGNPTGLEAGLAGNYDIYGGVPITIRIRVPTADIEAGEDIILGLMDDLDPLSIVAALDSDRTLGGVIDTLYWADGFPWTGLTDFQDPSGNGFFVGSTMTVVIVKANAS